MQTPEMIKQVVKDKYGDIAKISKSSGCCSCGCDSASDYSDFSEDYSALAGYNPDADLGLGCGLPTELAQINPGDTVLDLGSGAGNDVFIARSLVGDSGRVLGVDMTQEMIDKARTNLGNLGHANIEFRLGDLENLPVQDNEIDVTISNCVLNLVPDKAQAFLEIYRTLKPGGHFCISDIVLSGKLPEALRKNAEIYAGCVAGALQEKDYLDLIKMAGFHNIQIQKRRKIELGEDLLNRFLDEASRRLYDRQQIGIFSITVFGVKPD